MQNGLDALFTDLPEEWRKSLMPILSKSKDADKFCGGLAGVVPLRGLIFQALKFNVPANFNVVVFGQNPYPRVESATGVAFLDATFTDWEDSRFGKVVSMRNIVKAAAVQKYGIAKTTDVAALRKLLKKWGSADPQHFFASLLSQGVLLLNASLTASTDGNDQGLTATQHTKFWQPVVREIVEQILQAKSASGGGVCFAWWGDKAKALRKMVDEAAARHPRAKIAHVAHCNPAAMGDAFSQQGDVFGAINAALKSVGEKPVDFLPLQSFKAAESAKTFVASTLDAHKAFLERLGDVEEAEALPDKGSVALTAQAILPIKEAVASLELVVQGVEEYAEEALEFGTEHSDVERLSPDQIASIHLYTQSNNFYRDCNAALRDPQISAAKPFFPYLKLFLSALMVLRGGGGGGGEEEPKTKKSKGKERIFYRGVPLRMKYKTGQEVVWWGVSSCTGDVEVAHSFLSDASKSTLFEILSGNAVSIADYSSIPDEDEYILPPGTTLKVVSVSTKAGLCVVRLQDINKPKIQF